MLKAFRLVIVAGALVLAPQAGAQKAPTADGVQPAANSAQKPVSRNRDARLPRQHVVRKHVPVTAATLPVTTAVLPNNNLQGVLLLRDQYSTAPFISGDEELSKHGATISWTNNRLTNQTTIQGSGALFYALHGEMGLNTPGDVDSRAPRLTHLALVPGIEWDLTSRNGKNEGTVSARAGAEFEISGGLFPTQYLRGTVIYTTDIATSNAEIFGTEWSFLPVAPRLRIGGRTALSEQLGLWLDFVPTLNVEVAHVGRNGTLGTLMPNHDYLWVGPKLQADLLFLAGPLEGFSVYAKYFYLYDLLGSSNTSVNYLESGTRYTFARWSPAIDPANRANLSAVFKYTVGTTPRTLTRKDEFFAGLELKLGDLKK